MPERPAGWLYRVARNRALDRLRRETTFRAKEPEVRRELLPSSTGPDPARDESPVSADPRFSGELTDDQLRLIFLCCHPQLPRDGRVGLTLKTVCGFSVPEIGRAFLDRESTVAQRLVRAKKRIRDLGLPFEVPNPAELPERLDSVLEVLYLLFNEGYATSAGDRLVREDVCAEALRLSEELARVPGLGEGGGGALPAVHALAALFSFQASRLPGRVDAGGDLVLLERQDRSLWDRGLIRRGFAHLVRSAAGPRETRYHLEAAIASQHAAAASWEETDWPAILALYDRLAVLEPSPVVGLNRAVAVARVEGPEAGLKALTELEAAGGGALDRYHLLPATRGVLLVEAGDRAGAAEAFRAALEGGRSGPERRYLERRLAEALGGGDGEEG